MEWQPIETAPRDEIIIISGDGWVRAGCWNGRDPVWKWAVADNEHLTGVDDEADGFRSDGPCAPTHWMPLPEPRSETQHR